MHTWVDSFTSVAVEYSPLFGIAVAILSVTYMFGKMFQNDKWQKWALQEAWDLFYVMVFFFVTLPLLSNITSEVVRSIDPIGAHYYCQGISTSPVDLCFMFVGKGYLSSMVAENLGAVHSMLKPYSWLKMATMISITAHSGPTHYSRHPWASLDPLISVFEKYMDYLKNLLLITVFQYYMYDFFSQAALRLVVLGALLRILPMTRKLGGTILGITLAMVFFYPVMLAFFDSLYMSYPVSPHTHMRLNRFSFQGLSFSMDVPSGNLPYHGSPPTSLNLGDNSVGSNPNNPQGLANPIIQQVDLNTPPPASLVNAFQDDAAKNYDEVSEDIKASSEDLEDFSNSVASMAKNNDTAGITAYLKKFLKTTRETQDKLANNGETSLLWMFIQPFAGDIAASVVSTVGNWFGKAIGSVVSGTLGATLSHVVELAITGGTYIANVAASPLTATFLLKMEYSFIIIGSDIIANMIMFNAFFSYIAIIATIGAMKSASQFLGGDVEIAGLTQFI